MRRTKVGGVSTDVTGLAGNSKEWGKGQGGDKWGMMMGGEGRSWQEVWGGGRINEWVGAIKSWYF